MLWTEPGTLDRMREVLITAGQWREDAGQIQKPPFEEVTGVTIEYYRDKDTGVITTTDIKLSHADTLMVREDNAEYQVVPVDRLDVEPLLDVADRHHALERGAEGAVGEELRQRDGRVLANDADRGLNVAAPQRETSGQQVGQAGQQLAGGIRPLPFSENRDLAPPGLQSDAEGILDGPEVFVGDSDERGESGFGQGYGVAGFRNRRCSLRR